MELAGRRGSVSRVPISSRRLEPSSELARLFEGSGGENKINLHDAEQFLSVLELLLPQRRVFLVALILRSN